MLNLKKKHQFLLNAQLQNVIKSDMLYSLSLDVFNLSWTFLLFYIINSKDKHAEQYRF